MSALASLVKPTEGFMAYDLTRIWCGPVSARPCRRYAVCHCISMERRSFWYRLVVLLSVRGKQIYRIVPPAFLYPYHGGPAVFALVFDLALPVFASVKQSAAVWAVDRVDFPVLMQFGSPRRPFNIRYFANIGGKKICCFIGAEQIL